MKPHSKNIKALFIEHFPVHYDILGQSNLDDIIEDEAIFTSSEGGDNSVVFEVIVATGAIVNMMKMAFDYNRNKKESKELDELKSRQENLESILKKYIDEKSSDKLLPQQPIKLMLNKIMSDNVE